MAFFKKKKSVSNSQEKIKVKEYIALDIGDDSVKMVLVSRGDKSITLKSLVREPFPAKRSASDMDMAGFGGNSSEEAGGDAAHKEVVLRTIRKAYLQLNTKVKRVCLAIHGDEAISRIIQIPASVPVKNYIEHISITIPEVANVETENVYFDFSIIGVNSVSGDVDVHLLISRKEKVDALVHLAEDAELMPVAVDIEYNAMQYLLSYQGRLNDTEAVACVDIGATTMHINVVFNGRSVYQWSGDIALDRETGEAISLGDQESIDAARDTLVNRIISAIQVIQANDQVPSISQLYLSGGGALIPNIQHAITEHLMGTPCSIISPLEGVTIPKSLLKEVENVGSLYCVACGLAVRPMSHNDLL